MQEILNRLHRTLYLKLSREFESTLGTPTQEIKAYQSSFEREMSPLTRAHLKRVSQKDLFRNILKSDVTLIGDFHPFAQSQRTVLRVLRALHSKGKAQHWAIGLELFYSDEQKWLDAFLRRKLSLSGLTSKTQIEKRWGFPFSNYQPILEWALREQVPLIALNRPLILGSSLKRRDQWAAGIIHDYLETRPNSQVIALYGEWHLSQKHLPYELNKLGKVSTLCLHQNIEDLYWKQSPRFQSVPGQIYKISAKSYCVFSSTPWLKLQSALSWADQDLEDDLDTYQPFDVWPLFQEFYKALSKLLKSKRLNLDLLTLVSTPDSDLESEFLPYQRQWLKSVGTLYLPHSSTLYFPRPTPNHIAELCSEAIFYKHHPSLMYYLEEKPSFAALFAKEAFVFFCSLLINPNRKCELIADLKSKRSQALHPLDQRARKRVLQLLKTNRVTPEPYSTQSRLAARLWGQILGKKLYFAVLTHEIDLDELVTVFLSPLQSTAQEWPFRMQWCLKQTRKIKLAKTKDLSL